MVYCLPLKILTDQENRGASAVKDAGPSYNSTYNVSSGQGGGHAGGLHGRGLRVLRAADGAHQLLVEPEVSEAAHGPRGIRTRYLVNQTTCLNAVSVSWDHTLTIVWPAIHLTSPS